jgi:hypothetical protein
MLRVVRSRIATGALLVVLLAVAPPQAFGQGTSASPTPKQVASAVRRAERSKSLWATVNICDTHRHPRMIGIRGQVPALGFPASISIKIGVEFWSKTTKRFTPDPDATKLIRLTSVSNGIHQRGVMFQFARHAGRLRGTATFAWKRRGKLVGSAQRVTTPRHRDADFGDPAGFSAGTCTIK